MCGNDNDHLGRDTESSVGYALAARLDWKGTNRIGVGSVIPDRRKYSVFSLRYNQNNDSALFVDLYDLVHSKLFSTGEK